MQELYALVGVLCTSELLAATPGWAVLAVVLVTIAVLCFAAGALAARLWHRRGCRRAY